MEPTPDMDEIDRNIINRLQGGFPICERPYEEAARELGIGEEELIERLERMLEDRRLSRFGPMYHAENNYARDHQLNMWFVLATETPERIGEVLEEIERVTGYRVYNMPKLEEFYVGLHFEL